MSEFIHPDAREKKTLTDLEGNIKYFYTHNGRPRRQRERGELKTIRRNNGRKLYRFDEKKYLWISSNATNSKWKNTKRATERHIIIKLLKAKRKESFESREKKMGHYTWETNNTFNS